MTRNLKCWYFFSFVGDVTCQLIMFVGRRQLTVCQVSPAEIEVSLEVLQRSAEKIHCDHLRDKSTPT